MKKKWISVHVNIETYTSSGIQTGWLVVGVSRVSFSINQLISKFGVQLKAWNNNTGIIYIGGPDVTADQNSVTGGYPLAPGESIFLPTDHLENIYLISDTASQKLAKVVLK